MFRPARSVIRNLDLTERRRLNHMPQPPKHPLLPQRPAPAPRPIEWEFVQDASGRSQLYTDSVSSRSLYSSEMSAYTARLIYEAVFGEPVTPHGRPSSLHHQVTEESELEVFPKFMLGNENDVWSGHDSDETVRMKMEHEELKKHCVMHCRHYVCRHTRNIDKKKGIERECTSTCKRPRSAEPDADAFTGLTSSTAKAAYKEVDKEVEITIQLPTARALITHMWKHKHLDIQNFLLASERYGRDTIRESRFYKRAAKMADESILGGIEDSLITMLQHRPGQSLTLPVCGLEDLLRALAYWDCAQWMLKFVWGGGKKRGDANLWRLEAEMRRNKGALVLVERAEESVKDMVGGLIWWDGLERARTASS